MRCRRGDRRVGRDLVEAVRHQRQHVELDGDAWRERIAWCTAADADAAGHLGVLGIKDGAVLRLERRLRPVAR